MRHDPVLKEYDLNNINNSFSPLRVVISNIRGLVPGSRGTVPVVIATGLGECMRSPLCSVQRAVGKPLVKNKNNMCGVVNSWDQREYLDNNAAVWL